MIRIDLSFKNKLRELTGKRLKLVDIHASSSKFDSEKANFQSWMEHSDQITILNWSPLTKLSAFSTTHNSRVKLFKMEIVLGSVQGDAFDVPKGKCFNPIRDEKGVVIADYIENLIAVHSDLFHTSNEAQKIILIYILYKAKKLKLEVAKELLKTVITDFVDELTGVYNEWRFKRKDTLEKSLKSHESNIQSYEKEIIKFRKNIRKEYIELGQISKIKPVSKDDIIKLIKSIEKFPFVKSVVVLKRQIKITYKPIRLLGRNLGEYVLVIDGELKDILYNRFLRNKTTTSGGKLHHHPQMGNSGRICIGSYSKLRKQLSSGHIDVVVQGIWELLNNYNPRDHHCDGGIFLTVWDFFKKHPKSKFPSFMYRTTYDDYWKPETVVKLKKMYDKGAYPDPEDYADKRNVTGAVHDD